MRFGWVGFGLWLSSSVSVFGLSMTTIGVMLIGVSFIVTPFGLDGGGFTPFWTAIVTTFLGVVDASSVGSCDNFYIIMKLIWTIL